MARIDRADGGASVLVRAASAVIDPVPKVLDPELFVVTGPDARGAAEGLRPTVSFWQDGWRRFRKNPVAVAALAVIVFFAVMVVVGPYLRGVDFMAKDSQHINAQPDSQFWFGADALGRDLFSRVWVGARVSLTVAIACAVIQIVVGSVYGGVMAYFGGWVDEVMMRFIEFVNSIPNMLVMLLVMMVLGNSMWALLAAMCITSWVGTARQVRGLVKSLRESDYIAASVCLGTSPLKIIVKHLIPNTISILLLDLFMSIPSYIFSEASLSFLGLGLKPPEISLGTLISDAQSVLEIYPFELFFPSLVLCLIVLAFNLFGDGLRDALDPKMRR